MEPERWQQVSRILETVLGRDPNQRAAHLDEVCANDAALRREVESLLAASEHVGSLLDAPAMKLAAPLFVVDPTNSMLGQSIGRYNILSALGAGGMGDVYLAHDTRLGRKIALKLLPAHFTTDKDRLRRFEQEAHAASTLSHPNVCVIHEFGETHDGRHYIAMEYVEGVTLRQHISAARLGVNEALDVAIQVAAALAAAHTAGVVHRDIKPENIMVRSDGLIKVLDFGLAKLTEQQEDTGSQTTRPLVQTGTGSVMGTTTYMSPEQTRGLAVDGRTDIWSLGVVLYEMVAGHTPFEGETAGDLIAAILKTEPPPLAFYAAEASSELEHVARKTLQKERKSRYPTVGELLFDLKEIKQDLEFQAKLGRSARPAALDEANAARDSGQSRMQTAQVEAVQTDRDAHTHTTSSAEYLISEIKQHRTGVFITLGFFVGGVSLAFAIYHFARQTKPPVVHFQSMTMTRVTTEGSVGSAAISPDGKYLAYSLFEEGKASLWTKHLATGSRVQVVPPVEAGGLDPNTFTHDGGYIYYIRHDQQNPQGTLYQVPVLGGASKKILTNIAWPVSLSPDGRQFAFGRYYDDSNEDELLVANADGTNEHSLLRPKNPGWLNEAAASWSPDGKMLAVGYGKQEGGDHMLVAIVSVVDGTMRLMPTPRWFHIGPIVWFGDGNSLALQVEEPESAPPQIWQISYPGGEARRITNDLDSYTANSLTLTADASTLVAVQSETTSNIWIAPAGDPSSARAIKSSKYAQDGYDGLTWAPDGRVVYDTRFNGKDSIWAMNSDGSNPKPLTDSTADDSLPEVTADGRYIAFVSLRPGSSQEWRMEQVWRIDIDGSNPKQLSAERNGVGTVCLSPDSHWAIYGTIGDVLRKVSIDGGTPTKLTDKVEHYPEVSPDGRLLAYISVDDQRKRPKITIAAFDDGTPIRTLDMPGATIRKFRWSHDGRALIYVRTRNGVSNLWSQPLDGGAPRQLTDFDSDLIYNFSYSRDGKQLALARGNMSRDVVMISEAK